LARGENTRDTEALRRAAPLKAKIAKAGDEALRNFKAGKAPAGLPQGEAGVPQGEASSGLQEFLKAPSVPGGKVKITPTIRKQAKEWAESQGLDTTKLDDIIPYFLKIQQKKAGGGRKR